MKRLILFAMLLAACQSTTTPGPLGTTVTVQQIEHDRLLTEQAAQVVSTSTPTPSPSPTFTATAPASPTPQAIPLPESPLLFYVAADECVVKAVSTAGGESIVLTTNPPPFNCWRPTFSPDGKKLAFLSDDGNFNFYVMNLDGSDLASIPINSTTFAWSPDSRQVAYRGYDPQGAQSGLYVVDADGSNPHSIGYEDVSICNSCDGLMAISWSPDGEWIYAPADVNGPESALITANIFKVDGSQHIQLGTMEVSFEHAAVWVPDGQRLALPIDPEWDGCADILIASTQGETQMLSAETAYKFGEPGPASSCFNFSGIAWSPDGQSILAYGHPRGDFSPGEVTYNRILVAPMEGKYTYLLEYWPGHPGASIWSPDGTQFAFVSTLDFNSPSGNGPLVLMRNDPEFPDYQILAEAARNEVGALFWLQPSGQDATRP